MSVGIFNWIRTGVSAAIVAGIQDGVTRGLASVTGGAVTTLDAERLEAPEVEPKPEKPEKKTPKKRQASR